MEQKKIVLKGGHNFLTTPWPFVMESLERRLFNRVCRSNCHFSVNGREFVSWRLMKLQKLKLVHFITNPAVGDVSGLGQALSLGHSL